MLMRVSRLVFERLRVLEWWLQPLHIGIGRRCMCIWKRFARLGALPAAPESAGVVVVAFGMTTVAVKV